jgi:uncharacterized membrane protein
MLARQFSIGEAVGFGWNTVTRNLFYFVGLVLVVFVLEGIFQGLATAFRDSSSGLAFVFNVLAVAVQLFLTIGLIRIALKFVDGQRAEFSELFSGGPLILNYLVASFLYGLMVGVGTIFFIIPGIILAIMFCLYQFAIVDRAMGPIESLKHSADLTKGVRWQLFLLGLTLLGVNILGALAFGIGLLVTVPTSMVALAYVYRLLDRQTVPAGSIQVQPA